MKNTFHAKNNVKKEAKYAINPYNFIWENVSEITQLIVMLSDLIRLKI